MGCDIDLFIESSCDGIHWVSEGERDIDRWYDLFSLMAEVRSDGRQTLYTARGLPDDCSPGVEFEVTGNSYTWLNSHSYSWLTLQEMLAIRNVLGDGNKGLDDLIFEMGQIEASGRQVRVVFWFDD